MLLKIELYKWRHFFRAAAVGACLAASCLAQSFTFNLKQAGNVAGAQFSASGPDSFASVYMAPGNPFGPTPANGFDTYVITWSFTRYVAPLPLPPAEPLGMVSLTATAIVPIAKIKLSPSGGIAFDLDVSSPEVMWASKMDCSTLPCVGSNPASFPLKGSFEWYTGMQSSINTSSGSQESRNITADYFNNQSCIDTRSFSGQSTSGSANFAGVIGDLNVIPPQVGSNAGMSLNKGMLRIDHACTPLVTK
jgi:hypothetical protein